jgi:two-component system, chemotaxis family, protein-glutamate methylesterase/glutaminase
MTFSRARESESEREYAPRPVVVVGASLGGVDALRTLGRHLPADFAAPLIVVLHVGAHSSILPDLITRAGPLRARHVHQGMTLEPGEIYIAPPDHHVLIEQDALLLSRGPKEHHARPAIDPLFRSAALSRGPNAIGVVLTGMLDDGTAGLQAIKANGGIAIAQDPAQAFEPSMPASASRHVALDHCTSLEGIAALLPSLVALPRPSDRRAVDALTRHESDLFLSKGDPVNHLESIAKPSTLTCPDCGGSLWRLDDVEPPRYRCHTGHGFSIRTLTHAHETEVDQAMWSALRALQERQKLLECERDATGLDAAARQRIDERCDHNRESSERLRSMIEALD